MSKPWDKLRTNLPPNNPLPIGGGTWITSKTGAAVGVCVTGAQLSGLVSVGVFNDTFGAADLRELAEFCTELADQLEPQ